MSSNVEHPEEPIRAESESTSLERVEKPRHQVRELVHHATDYAGKMSRRITPTGAAAVAGGLAVGAAILLGPGPTAVGLGAAYAAYRMMQKRKALEEEAPQDPPPPITGF